ncbi:flagellar basal body L-ring protein FlgH [Geotalea uraniireducens]|uniref:Flagellar L-ring protein n=1 Tax=Geotalea uraniireducens (strain Rf4) TaxID=351605 RepID=A5G8X9_GEOUR|nr:flagellar L-ring protein [Geotalea uraniireducens Rf4]
MKTITCIKMMSLPVLLLLAACSIRTAEVRTPAFDEQLQPSRPNYANGSIWQDSSSGFADDFKARKRGDTVTVVINEQSSASKQATTGTTRGSSISAGIPNLLGLETNVTGIKNWMDLNKLISASFDSKFDGSGKTTRQENLNATITAKVVDVLGNGNLLIEGKRNVKVNNEDQVIVLTGTVRPRDISSDNVVNSIYVADARINYSGKGIISDRQKPGWLMGLFDTIWPF